MTERLPQRYTSEIACSGWTAWGIKRDANFGGFESAKMGYSILGVKSYGRKVYVQLTSTTVVLRRPCSPVIDAYLHSTAYLYIHPLTHSNELFSAVTGLGIEPRIARIVYI